MPLGEMQCERLWRMAEASEMGITVPIASNDDLKIVWNELYTWRQVNGGYENFVLTVPDGGGELFIYRKPVEIE